MLDQGFEIMIGKTHKLARAGLIVVYLTAIFSWTVHLQLFTKTDIRRHSDIVYISVLCTITSLKFTLNLSI